MKWSRWYSTFKHSKGWHFIIEDDPSGYYLFVYEHKSFFDDDMNEPVSCSHHQQDHHQDTIEQAKEQAEEDFGVPLNSWVEIQD